MNFEEDYDHDLFLAQQQSLEELRADQRRRTRAQDECEIAIQASIASEEKRARREREKLQSNEDEELAFSLSISEETAVITERVHTSHAILESQLMAASELRDQQSGSWDCGNCTFTNQPYAATCCSCGTRAPPHLLTFPSLPKVDFGVELELLIPNGRRDGFTLEFIAKKLNESGAPSVRYTGYTHETTHHWKVVTDSSINQSQPSRDLTCELVSPVLSGEVGIGTVRTMIDHVRRVGIAINKTCGFHVHVNAESGTSLGSLDALRRISQAFCSLENAFDLLVSRSRRQNKYCKSNRLGFGERSNRQRWDVLGCVSSRAQLVEWMNPAKDRYRKLNLTNLVDPSRPSTIEFRMHDGVDDILRAEGWIRLVIEFCHQAGLGPTSKCLLPESSLPRDEVSALFNLIDCSGLEQFYGMEKRLFAKAKLHNTWKCPKCRKVFSTSRSLSQHCLAVGH